MEPSHGPSADGSDGFTLIEVLISLVLFALISLAGVSLVTTVVDVQERTEVRGARLAQVQRALYLLSADFEQMTEGPFAQDGTVQIVRASAGGEYEVAYAFADGAISRGSGESEAILLDGVQSLTMRVLLNDQWEPIPQVVAADQPMPRALEIVLELAPRANETSGPVRRVIELPTVRP
ncbi:prepilin-type N-terminal cleavage/methylation domain-containing protein [Tsuneonella sp. HG222]